MGIMGLDPGLHSVEVRSSNDIKLNVFNPFLSCVLKYLLLDYCETYDISLRRHRLVLREDYVSWINRVRI